MVNGGVEGKKYHEQCPCGIVKKDSGGYYEHHQAY